MVDELDPRLEAALRAALHAEADAFPVLVREQDLERARRRRRARPLAIAGSLLGAAAVLVLLVATGFPGRLALVGGDATPSPTATARPLASYEELLALIEPGATPLLQGERTSPTEPGTKLDDVDLGLLPADTQLALGVHCLGGSIDLIIRKGTENVGTHRINCSIQPARIPLLVNPFDQTLYDGTEHVLVRAAGGVRWRILVAATTAPAPSMVAAGPSFTPGPTFPSQDPGASLSSLPTFGELEALPYAPRSVLFRSEGEPEAESSEHILGDVVALFPLRVSIACTWGEIGFEVRAGGATVYRAPVTCPPDGTTASLGNGLATSPAGGQPLRLVVVTPPGLAWRVVVGTGELKPPPAGGCAGLTGPNLRLPLTLRDPVRDLDIITGEQVWSGDAAPPDDPATWGADWLAATGGVAGRAAWELFLGGYCAGSIEIRYADIGVVNAAVAGGRAPTAESIVLDTHGRPTNRFPFELQRTGTYVMRVTTAWTTVDGSPAFDVQLFKIEGDTPAR